MSLGVKRPLPCVTTQLKPVLAIVLAKAMYLLQIICLYIYIYGLIQCFNIFWLIHEICISKCYYDISGIYLIHLHFWNRFAAKFLIQFPWFQIDLRAARRRSCNCWSLPERLLISIASRFQGLELGEFSGLPSTSHNAPQCPTYVVLFLGWIDGQRHSMKFVFLVAETKKYVKK